MPQRPVIPRLYARCMCDYCGCRESGPTAELAREHVRLGELSEQIRKLQSQGDDFTDVFNDFSQLLDMHAAKEEVGLFPQVLTLGKLDEDIEQLVAEHGVLHEQLQDGPGGEHVMDALKLLAQHIDDEEFSLFPHVFHQLDPEQWDEIELAHRAVDLVFTGSLVETVSDHSHDHSHSHDHDHPHDHEHPHDHSHSQDGSS